MLRRVPGVYLHIGPPSHSCPHSYIPVVSDVLPWYFNQLGVVTYSATMCVRITLHYLACVKRAAHSQFPSPPLSDHCNLSVRTRVWHVGIPAGMALYWPPAGATSSGLCRLSDSSVLSVVSAVCR
jgi:hypothetical protein